MKYCATIVGFSVVSLPLMHSAGSGADLIAKHRTSDALITNASAAIGDLIMVHKKAQQLGGFSIRLCELLDGFSESEKACSIGPEKTTEDQSSKDRSSSQRSLKSKRRGWSDDDLRNVVETRKVSGGLPRVPSNLSQPLVRFDSLTVEAPDGRVLLRNLSLAIRPKCNLFVTGPNGCGKTSLFRVLAGLWVPASGSVMVPKTTKSGGIFYLPQRPYLVCGSLRDQVLYPKLEPSYTPEEDAKVAECLQHVGLGKFTEDLERFEEEWDAVLSGGEKQRLAFARLLFHKPTFAVLDEATAAVNIEAQGLLYSLLEGTDITFFSIAHRAELRRYHQMELHLKGDGTGGWALNEMRSSPTAASTAGGMLASRTAPAKNRSVAALDISEPKPGTSLAMPALRRHASASASLNAGAETVQEDPDDRRGQLQTVLSCPGRL